MIVNPTSGIAPETIMFNAIGSLAPDGAITNYSWSFGDGSIATGMMVNHTYTAAGTFTATLTVIDNLGVSASKSTIITIVANHPPISSFVGSSETSGPLNYQFDASASCDSGGR